MRTRLESRRLASLPFDAATDTRQLLTWHLRAAQQRLARRAQVCTVHRQLVAGPAGIELSTVREPSLAIEQKELRRTDGLVRLSDVLRLIVQVWKGETLLRSDTCHFCR